MNNILVIPDIHGEKRQFKIISERPSIINNYKKVVFIGDYWDSFSVPFEEQKACFLEIIKLKQKYLDKIVLLLGNHDVHYMTDKARYSGFQDVHAFEIKDLMEQYKDLFQSAYQFKDVLFTHAGLSQTFLEYLLKGSGFTKLIEVMQEGLYKDAADLINNLSIEKLHTYTKMDGHHEMNNISFIRPDALRNDLIPELSLQVVGHTHDKMMRMYKGLVIVDSSHPLEIDM